MAGIYYKNGSSFSQVTASDVGASASSHTHSAATTSAAGFMSAADKTKLNGIATGANAYSLPTASSSTLGGVKTTSTVTSTSGLTACPIISGVPYYKDTNTTYSLSSFGVTATAAELNYVDGVTSNIQTQLNGKAASSHTHSYLPLSGGTITGNLTVNGNLSKCCCAVGTASSLSLAASTITTVTLASWHVRTDSSLFTFSGGGIKVATAGNYLIAGSVYVNSAASDLSYGRGVYLYNGSTEIASEIVNGSIGGAVCTAPKILALSAGAVIYLKTRSINIATTAYPNNSATYLTIMKV